MCYNTAGEGTLVAGEVNTAPSICSAAELTCASVLFLMGSMFNYPVAKAHVFQFVHN